MINMIFNFFKKKLGITELSSVVSKLLKLEEERKAQSVHDAKALDAGFDSIYRCFKQCSDTLISIEKDNYLTLNSLGQLDEKNKNIRREIIDQLKSLESNSISRTKDLKRQIENYQQSKVDEKEIYERILKQLVKDQEEKPKERIVESKPVVVEEKKEEPKSRITYSDDVLDRNYFNALVGNIIPNCYNSSDIVRIPNNYTLFSNAILKRVGTGMQNRHCYDNALLFGKERKEVVYIGIIFPKSALSQVLLDEEKKKKITITPYLHAWNMTADNQIADYTLGKRAENYVYVGRIIVPFDDISPKGLEEILRKELL